jgi:hypothetical protein
MKQAPRKLSVLLALAATLAVSSLAFARGGSKPSLPAPTNVAATEDCTSLGVTWDAVTGATKYAIEVTAVYNSTSLDCSTTDTTHVFSFTSTTNNISIDYGVFLIDFGLGNGPQFPCSFTLVKVKALNPPGKGATTQNNPFGSATPTPNCAG